jgi:broad specificity phosphatase PhoE
VRRRSTSRSPSIGLTAVRGVTSAAAVACATVLLLVRHGQTEANAQGLLLGLDDPPLTELGRRQADDVARALPTPSRVISSPLQRALATAAAFDAPVEVDERWIELDYGEYDGRAANDVSPDVWRRWRSDVTYSPGGGESLADLGRRVRAACVDIAGDASERIVVVVTHVSPIKAAIAWALRVPDDVAWRMYVEDAGISRIDLQPEGPTLRWFNRHAMPAPSAG